MFIPIEMRSHATVPALRLLTAFVALLLLFVVQQSQFAILDKDASSSIEVGQETDTEEDDVPTDNFTRDLRRNTRKLMNASLAASAGPGPSRRFTHQLLCVYLI